MEIIYLDKNTLINVKSPLVCTIGAFDGLHQAHQKLISLCIEEAKKSQCQSAVITFDPHPDYVLGKRYDEGLLTPITQKCQLLSDMGIDYTIIVNFTRELAALSPQDFGKIVLGQLAIKHIFVGSDFRYGFKGEGTAASLNSIAPTTIINLLTYHDEKMGSEQIRLALREGKMDIVNDILRRPYTMIGEVIEGQHLGRTMGFPTANIALKDEYQNIKNGVYAVWVILNNHRYLGIANIGHNPTFNFTYQLRLEVHLLNFNENIYGSILTVEFIKFIREEKKFASKEDLIREINKNVLEAQSILKEKI